MDPSGTFIQYDAKAIGSGSEGAQQSLQEVFHKVPASIWCRGLCLWHYCNHFSFQVLCSERLSIGTDCEFRSYSNFNYVILMLFLCQILFCQH